MRDQNVALRDSRQRKILAVVNDLLAEKLTVVEPIRPDVRCNGVDTSIVQQRAQVHSLPDHVGNLPRRYRSIERIAGALVNGFDVPLRISQQIVE